MENINQIVESWLNGNYDQETKDQIKLLPENELVDCFYKGLEFGTGGLRGLMGVGTNRVNKYTIGMATQGLSNYLKKTYPNENIKVAIAHDSRNNSDYFAKITADVFSANGIKVYFFEGMRPTPELSFTIRHFGCHSGVVLTASHNPKEYNGYKAYWNDGAQVISPHDKNIVEEVRKIKDISQVNFNGNKELIELIGSEIDNLYINYIKSLSLSKSNKLKIVYTPLHGTGVNLVPETLKAFGFTDVNLVKEQITPDGNFPTVIYPNPEEKDAMNLALKLAKEIDADLLMGTDPDSDRVGIGLKNNKREFVLLNGNQTAALLFNYVLEKSKKVGNEFVVKTIVTSNLLEKITLFYNVKIYNTLTGFKYIAALIKKLEGSEKYLVGGEESFGYLVGDQVRDKDAIASCAMIAEMVADAKASGKSAFEKLIEIYIKFGFFKEDLFSITKKSKSGAEEIALMMKKLRAEPPTEINGSKIIEILDYENLITKNLTTGISTNIDLPKENVLQFKTEDGSLISIRPSGTEPKIKVYFSVQSKLDSYSDYENVNKLLDSKLTDLANEIKNLL